MYFSCHNHTERGSNFRLRDAITRIPDLITYAHELGLKGVCITEHESISSAMDVEKFFDTVRDKPGWEDFKVGLGNEIYLCSEDVNEENARNGTFNDKPMVFPHFILIALNAEGHRQIRELSTKAWMRSFMHRGMMRVPTYWSDLIEVIGSNKGNVVASSACLGSSICRFILANQNNPKLNDMCVDWIDMMVDMFGEGYFFLEMQPTTNDEQHIVNRKLLELSKITGVPYIITTDVHYCKKEDAIIHKTFLNSQDGDREVDSFYSTTYVMSADEIHEHMDEHLGANAVQKGLDNTLLIYDRVESYSLKKPLHIPYLPLDTREPDKNLYEKYVTLIPNLKEFYESEYDSDRHMVRRIAEAIDNDESFQEQIMYDHINDCLDTIQKSSEKMKTRWSAYLLQVADYVNIVWEKADSLVGAARGSGCGFGLLNVLGITQINPLHETTKTYPFRFLNPERASVLDIDIDVESTKRDQIMQAFKDTYGADRVSKVMTYGTEGSRSAIITVARGLGIDNDVASYIASLVVADRGTQRSLTTMYYGDDDNKPIPEFVKAMDEYPELFEGAKKIEGICSSCGSHAGGVIFVDEPFTNTTALMKTNSGDIVTQFDLHNAEDASLIKIDLLSIEGLDKIRACLDLLVKDGRVQWQGSLKKTYESVIGIKNLERKAPEMWRLLHEHRVLSLFQMEKDSGVQALSLIKPTNVDQLASLNSVIRLMAQEEGGEVPLKKYARFRHDPNEWHKEMDDAGLTKEEQEVIKKHLSTSCGVCIYQEQIMMLVMEPMIGGFSLNWADKLRKAVAKLLAG